MTTKFDMRYSNGDADEGGSDKSEQSQREDACINSSNAEIFPEFTGVQIEAFSRDSD